METKSILHIGVKCKSCQVCTIAETNKRDPPFHDCFKNWTDSSQSIEANIILEGFKTCEEKHGVRYMRYIGDGDSSSYATLLNEGPSWCRDVKKIYCANHACKCLRVNLENLVTDKPDLKGPSKLTKNRRVHIVSYIRCAITHRSKDRRDIAGAKLKLEKDIRSSVYHAFGEHSFCNGDFCKSGTTDFFLNEEKENQDEDDETKTLIELSQYWENASKVDFSSTNDNAENDKDTIVIDKYLINEVMVVLERLISKSDSLINNFTSNLAENWMAIRAKFDGGKFFNRTQKGSWYGRCYGASLRRNQGTLWSPKVWETVTKTKASAPFVEYFEQCRKSQLRQRICKARFEVKKRAKYRKLNRNRCANSRRAIQAYGPKSIQPSEDLKPDEVISKCNNYYDSQVNISAQECKKIEETSRNQGHSKVWVEERKKRITASNFGEVVLRRQTTLCAPLVRRLLYSKFKGNDYTRYGLREEKNTIKEYIEDMSKCGKNLKVEKAGLCIDIENNCIAATPDGIIFENGDKVGLFECKNVLKNKNVTFREACSKSKTFCLEINSKGDLQLKRNNKYYYQVQGQANIWKLPWVDFIVRSCNPNQLHIERIYRDVDMWNKKMLPKILAFYNKAILPELACPREGKFPGIREPGIDWYTQPKEVVKEKAVRRNKVVKEKAVRRNKVVKQKDVGRNKVVNRKK